MQHSICFRLYPTKSHRLCRFWTHIRWTVKDCRSAADRQSPDDGGATTPGHRPMMEAPLRARPSPTGKTLPCSLPRLFIATSLLADMSSIRSVGSCASCHLPCLFVRRKLRVTPLRSTAGALIIFRFSSPASWPSLLSNVPFLQLPRPRNPRLLERLVVPTQHLDEAHGSLVCESLFPYGIDAEGVSFFTDNGVSSRISHRDADRRIGIELSSGSSKGDPQSPSHSPLPHPPSFGTVSNGSSLSFVGVVQWNILLHRNRTPAGLIGFRLDGNQGTLSFGRHRRPADSINQHRGHRQLPTEWRGCSARAPCSPPSTRAQPCP